MPVQECNEDNKKGYKWGEQGKCYTYESGNDESKNAAKEKAAKQGKAIKSQMSDILDIAGYIPVAFTNKGMRLADFNKGTIQMSSMEVETTEDGDYTVVDAVAAVGDKFYGNIFVASNVFKASVDKWNNTYNDLSHLGTMYPAAMSFVENLDYITGYNSDAHYDDAIDGIRVKMHISHNSPKYNSWKSFIDISKNANRIPNVSIFGFSKFERTSVKDLPSGLSVPIGAAIGGKVISMANIIPFAITTCLRGKCDDSEGCGISSNFTEDGDMVTYSCDGEECKIELETVSKPEDEKIVDEKQINMEDEERKKQIMNRIKELK